MSVTTISSRDFNQDLAKAKRNSLSGPVVITDRGKPSHVLLSFEQYEKLTAQGKNIVQMLSMPDTDDIEFEAPKIEGTFYNPEDFTS